MQYFPKYFRPVKTGKWLIATIIVVFAMFTYNYGASQTEVVAVRPAPPPEPHPFKFASLFAWPPDSLNQITLAVDKGAPGQFDSTFAIIKKRFLMLDKEGEIKADKNNSRIIVTTAQPLDDITKKYLISNGRLQFYECYTIAELAPSLKKADSIYYTLAPESVKKEIRHKKDHPDTSYEKLKKAGAKKPGPPDFPDFDYNLHLAQGQTNYTVDIGEQGFSIAFSDTSLLLNAVFPNGIYSKEQLTEPMFGFFPSKHDTAKADSMLQLPAVRAVLPANLKLSWFTYDIKEYASNWFFKLYILLALKSTGIPGHAPILEGDIIKKARIEKDKNGKPVLNMQMNDGAAKVWAGITRDNTGKYLAMALDNQVYRFEVVNSENKDGLYHTWNNSYMDYISDSTIQSIADIVNAGSLPLKVSIAGVSHIKSGRGAFFGKRAVAVYVVILFLIAAGAYIFKKKSKKAVA